MFLFVSTLLAAMHRMEGLRAGDKCIERVIIRGNLMAGNGELGNLDRLRVI